MVDREGSGGGEWEGGSRGVGFIELSIRRDFSPGQGVRKCGSQFCPELAV